MKKVLIVGAGGIGSWLAWNLHHLNQHKQIPQLDITFADNDSVDTKNLSYQLFQKIDLMDNKATVVANKYNFNGLETRIESDSQLKGYDCIVCAVDNSKFRRLMFNYGDKNSTYWIDLRSVGTAVAFYTKHKENTLKKMLETIPDENSDHLEGSCQLEFELENNIVQCGNRIIASIGAQLILNWYRGVTNTPGLTYRF